MIIDLLRTLEPDAGWRAVVTDHARPYFKDKESTELTVKRKLNDYGEPYFRASIGTFDGEPASRAEHKSIGTAVMMSIAGFRAAQ